MADAALFIGWGEPVRGREVEAVKAFEEAVAFYAQRQEHGEIESFEPVLLTPHGGDLGGFILVRGTEEQLFRLQTSDEFLAMQSKVRLIVENLGFVSGVVGEGLTRAMAAYAEQAAAVHA